MMGEGGVRNTAIVLSLALHGAVFWSYGERLWRPADTAATSHPIIIARLNIAEPKPAEPRPQAVTLPKPAPPKPAPPKPRVVPSPKPKTAVLRPRPVPKAEPVLETVQQPERPEPRLAEVVEAKIVQTPVPEQPTPTAVAMAGSEPALPDANMIDEEQAAEERRRYLAALQAAIARHKEYPAMARRHGIEGRVEVSFLLLADGDARDIRVSGGPRPLRKAARRAVHKALRFPPPPSGISTPLPVQYAMNFSLR